METLRYEVDPHNRLVITNAGKKSGLTKFRRVLDGRFKLESGNTLSYHVKASTSNEENIPHQIKLKGKWSLTKNHDLTLTLNKWGRQTFGDKLTISGEILDTGKNSLLFAVTSWTKDGVKSKYALKLKGKWQADKYNRLTFSVYKENGGYDTLTFSGAWEIARNHELVYRYERSFSSKGAKKVKSLIFKGRWDILGRARVSYLIDRTSGSAFNFKTSLGIFKERSIKYVVEIGLRHKPNSAERVITLFGKWRLKRSGELSFDVECGGGKARAITFGFETSLANKDKIAFRLKAHRSGEDLGVSVAISRQILKRNGEIYLKFLKDSKETSVLGGVGMRW